MNRRPLNFVAASIAIVPTCAIADWPCFRGPNHDGISSETGFRKEWKEPIPFVWGREVGSAFSSFACVGDRVYTGGTADGSQTLVSLDAAAGNVVWQVAIEMEYRESQGGDGPRATPTVDGSRVYILAARGALQCRDVADGKLIWETKFSHPPQWGYSASVLIEGNLAVATGGESDGTLAAFDKATGKPAWKCGDDPAGYATPYPFTFEGRRYIVGFAGGVVIIAEAASGRLVWRQDWKTDWGVNASSPIFHDGYLFLSSGYSTGCGLFKLRVEGDALAGEKVWASNVLMNKFQSCVLHDGKLYSSDQRALVCADFLTGAEHWRVHRVKHGTVLLADGHLIVLTQDGELQIGPSSPGGFEPVTKADVLDDRCWTVPVLHRGKLYVRNLTRVACFDLSR